VTIMKPEIIVLGHSGFIGKALCDQLNIADIAFQGISSSDIDLRKSESITALNQRFTKNTVLIFSAAIIRQKGDNLETLQDNIKMAINVAKSLENHPIDKCIYLSTADVYGHPDSLLISENTPINPLTNYASAKWLSESLMESVCLKTHTPSLTLRYSGIFGPGQRQPRYGPNSFIDSVIKKENVNLWGDGEELRDMVYVKDLAKIIVQLSQNNIQGILNIATGKSTTFQQTAEMICQLMPYQCKIIHRERNGPKFDQVFDISKLKQSLPNLCFTPLNQAFREMLYIN